MMWEPFSPTERQRLLEARSAALARYNRAMDRIAECRPASEKERAAVSAAEDDLAEATNAERAYFDGLPRVVMSCCPFDGRPLLRTFDPHGMDGPWWRPDATPADPPGCPHFCVLRAAVRHPDTASAGQAGLPVHTGPQAPYVVPRLFEFPEMTAVLSQFEAANGATVYPVAYFAPHRPPAQKLAANWPRNVFLYTTAMGRDRWRFDNEVCDFDLAPWIARGRVRWCPPGSNNERLGSPAEHCPFLDLPAHPRN